MNSNTQHTPGPWIVNCCSKNPITGYYNYVVSVGEGDEADEIVRVVEEDTDALFNMGHTVSGANATLIAAAPDLLAALKRLSVLCDQMERGESVHPQALYNVNDEARAALAKATAAGGV